ncbi:hypothetical protein RJ639_015923 [Escallonia herrerae]|uniref:Uncharacterized protein n=1 Tax=Escallonia herrerae TaxID=1293975 RepID=A0AA88VB01_9ASTE|nr:hypothetical protein RJ639_015923 [Escallonia herrerae]
MVAASSSSPILSRFLIKIVKVSLSGTQPDAFIHSYVSTAFSTLFTRRYAPINSVYALVSGFKPSFNSTEKSSSTVPISFRFPNMHIMSLKRDRSGLPGPSPARLPRRPARPASLRLRPPPPLSLPQIPLIRKWVPSPPTRSQVDTAFESVARRFGQGAEDITLGSEEFKAFAVELFGGAVVSGAGRAIMQRVPVGVAGIAGIGAATRSGREVVGAVIGVYALGVATSGWVNLDWVGLGSAPRLSLEWHAPRDDNTPHDQRFSRKKETEKNFVNLTNLDNQYTFRKSKISRKHTWKPAGGLGPSPIIMSLYCKPDSVVTIVSSHSLGLSSGGNPAASASKPTKRLESPRTRLKASLRFIKVNSSPCLICEAFTPTPELEDCMVKPPTLTLAV